MNLRIEWLLRYRKHEYFNENGEPIRCILCGGTHIHRRVTDSQDYMVLEEEYICANCSQRVGYWAYGYFDPCFFYPTQPRDIWRHIKWRTSELLRAKSPPFVQRWLKHRAGSVLCVGSPLLQKMGRP